MHPADRKAVRNQAAAYAGKATEKRLNVSAKIHKAVLVAFFVGCTTFLLGVAITIVTTYAFRETPISAFADDFIIGVFTGLVVLWYERRRNRYLIERLRIIEEMNHHVRNALQAVSYSVHLSPDDKLRAILRESSDRIEWALYEVLPGKTKP